MNNFLDWLGTGSPAAYCFAGGTALLAGVVFYLLLLRKDA